MSDAWFAAVQGKVADLKEGERLLTEHKVWSRVFSVATPSSM